MPRDHGCARPRAPTRLGLLGNIGETKAVSPPPGLCLELEPRGQANWGIVKVGMFWVLQAIQGVTDIGQVSVWHLHASDAQSTCLKGFVLILLQARLGPIRGSFALRGTRQGQGRGLGSPQPGTDAYCTTRDGCLLGQRCFSPTYGVVLRMTAWGEGPGGMQRGHEGLGFQPERKPGGSQQGQHVSAAHEP